MGEDALDCGAPGREKEGRSPPALRARGRCNGACRIAINGHHRHRGPADGHLQLEGFLVDLDNNRALRDAQGDQPLARGRGAVLSGQTSCRCMNYLSTSLPYSLFLLSTFIP